jgi:hypothetical protein
VPGARQERFAGIEEANARQDVLQLHPEPELIAALTRLTEAAFQQWSEKRWV